MKFFLVVCLLATPAVAREYRFTKKVVPGRLQADLAQGGFSIDHIDCSGDRLDHCVIFMPDSETKNPAAIVQAYVYSDPRSAFAARRTEAAGLVGKLKNGTISSPEKDRLLLLMAQLLSLGD